MRSPASWRRNDHLRIEAKNPKPSGTTAWPRPSSVVPRASGRRRNSYAIPTPSLERLQHMTLGGSADTEYVCFDLMPRYRTISTNESPVRRALSGPMTPTVFPDHWARWRTSAKYSHTCSTVASTWTLCATSTSGRGVVPSAEWPSRTNVPLSIRLNRPVVVLRECPQDVPVAAFAVVVAQDDGPREKRSRQNVSSASEVSGLVFVA